MYWGGPRLANFIAANLYGPEVHSIYRWRKQHSITLYDGINIENFKMAANIYSHSMKNAKLTQVPVELSEDETVIIKKITYDEKTDSFIGFCGIEEDNHQCMTNIAIKVGDGEHGYQQIVNAFTNYRIGNYARVVMINPVHPNLPKIPIFNMTSCNSFDAGIVQSQAFLNEQYYNEHLKDILGPLIGFASDGDSRRRKMFLAVSTSNEGERFQPIPSDYGFIFTAKKKVIEDSYTISGLCDQDFIHNHKKLVNHLDRKARNLRMGNYSVHLNHIREVYEKYPSESHGITKSDIDRDDRQN